MSAHQTFHSVPETGERKFMQEVYVRKIDNTMSKRVSVGIVKRFCPPDMARVLLEHGDDHTEDLWLLKDLRPKEKKQA